MSPELTLSLAFLCRKPGDGVEFFAQMRLILKKGEGRQGLPCPEVRTARSCCLLWGQRARPSPQPLLQQASTPPSLECSPQVALTLAPLTGPPEKWFAGPC